MELTELTTYDDIRAVLGVSSDELEDATLSLSVYAYDLEADLRDVSPSFLTKFRAAQSSVNRTDAEDWFIKMAGLFATYSVARNLTTALPLFSPKEISDSKVAVSRYAANPYLDTIKSIKEQYGLAKSRVDSAIQNLNSSTVASSGPFVSTLMRVSTGVDPVTGE